MWNIHFFSHLFYYIKLLFVQKINNSHNYHKFIIAFCSFNNKYNVYFNWLTEFQQIKHIKLTLSERMTNYIWQCIFKFLKIQMTLFIQITDAVRLIRANNLWYHVIIFSSKYLGMPKKCHRRRFSAIEFKGWSQHSKQIAGFVQIPKANYTDVSLVWLTTFKKNKEYGHRKRILQVSDSLSWLKW